MIRMIFVYGLFVAVIVFFEPATAYAWGPGMHVEIALAALANVAVAAPFIRELISRFPDAFIYGATSPDIVVGKKYAGYLHHCHNWRMGWMILKEARSERERAAAYGYLMHLAADVVAHNYYIPFKTVRSYSARLLSHTYWEMRFDLGVSEAAWKRLSRIAEIDSEEFDNLLDRVLKKTLFSFATNKRIFNTILILQKMRSLRKSLKLYARHSRFDIVEENREHYADLTMEAVFNFLTEPEGCECLQMDPAGIARLAWAKNLRNHMRVLARRGLVDTERAETFVEFVKERLAIGLYRPDMILPAAKDIL